MSGIRPPELLPLLSRGKHRSAQKGACFMELASFVAGEPWSDHPGCTHPLLASLARLVNDQTSDTGRPLLAPLIPDVIGLTSDDPLVDVVIAARAATTALPTALADQQRVLAVGVIVTGRLLDGIGAPPAPELVERGGDALASAPIAARWAGEFAGGRAPSARDFRRHGAASVVRHAVEAVTGSYVVDADAVLRGLLAAAIRDTETWTCRPDPALDPATWSAACRLVGTAPSER